MWLNITDVKLILEHIVYMPYHILKSLILLDKAFISGLVKALVLLPRVIDRRMNNIKTFRLSDQAIFNMLK